MAWSVFALSRLENGA